MIYNLKEHSEKKLAINYINNSEKVIEIIEKRKIRSLLQNRALHLFFTLIADALTNEGHQHKYKRFDGKVVEIKYTKDIIKEYYWRPLQIEMFNKKSTTQLEKHELNNIIEEFLNQNAESEIFINFPSRVSEYEDALKKGLVK